MRKTLQDVASYLKEIIVSETYEKYEINSLYTNVLDEKSIQEGLQSFRAFLVRFYDILCDRGNAYDTCKKLAHEYENRTTLSVYYPFIHNLSTILMRMGYYGTLKENSKVLFCTHSIFSDKLSVTKTLECLKFLVDCGINIDGIDLNEKKQNLANIKTIKITYPDNPTMLTGLKIMAIAEIDYRTLVNQDVFLRCDYRVLQKEKPDMLSIVQDTIKPLSIDVQNFIIHLHQHYLDKGLTCIVEIKGFHIYIKYCFKRKDIWGINASLNNGYHINIKSTKTDEYTGTIKTLSPVLNELIAKGYGCGRKREIGHCDGGCRGIPISLDDSVLDIQDDIKRWLDQELACLKKK